MAHVALGIEILSYSLSIVVLTLLLLVWKRDRSPGLLELTAALGSFTVLLVANPALRYTGIEFFGTVKALAAALMIYVIPLFSDAMSEVKGRPERRGRRGRRVLLGVWSLVLMAAVTATDTARLRGSSGISVAAAAVEAGATAERVVYTLLFVSLGIIIALVAGDVILQRRCEGREVGEGKGEENPPISWYVRSCRTAAFVTPFFLPFFVLFDFPISLNFLRTNELREVVSTFSAATVFLLLWNLLLLRGAVGELIRRGERGERGAVEDSMNAWMAGFGLSPRETEVCRLLIRGASYDQIEQALFISRSTVKTHTNRIYQKTGTRNQVDLMRRVSGEGGGPFPAPVEG